MIFFFCLVTTVSVVTLSGCINECGNISTTRIDNINADLVRVTGIGEDVNGYVHYNVESFPSGLASTSYDSIAFNISYGFISSFIQEQTTLPFMMNGAYACDGLGPSYERISSINIKSNADYDNIHQSGTSLNDIFVFSDSPNLNHSIDEYIDQYGYYGNILMMMSIAPEFESTHTFTIEITFEDGRVLSQQLEPVTIKI